VVRLFDAAAGPRGRLSAAALDMHRARATRHAMGVRCGAGAACVGHKISPESLPAFWRRPVGARRRWSAQSPACAWRSAWPSPRRRGRGGWLEVACRARCRAGTLTPPRRPVSAWMLLGATRLRRRCVHGMPGERAARRSKSATSPGGQRTVARRRRVGEHCARRLAGRRARRGPARRRGWPCGGACAVGRPRPWGLRWR
jgi:hypothetical protein